MVGSPLVFLKLGGSLITDKSRPYAARPAVIDRLAQETAEAVNRERNITLLLGHGSGSFGHWAAKPYSTREGVRTPDDWRGYAEVAAAAARLNSTVTSAFLDAGVPVLTLQPSATARCEDGILRHLDLHPIESALDRGLVPLLYGDVALDSVRGGTIISTEEIFSYLADRLSPSLILLAVDAPGVLGRSGELVDRLVPADLPELQESLGSSGGVDVTGGMATKVETMIELVRRQPLVRVRIVPGGEPGAVTQALLDPVATLGTLISAEPA
jgi:isopentenyl phosphate kinase